MGIRQPVTRTMKITEVKTQLNSLVNTVYRHEARVVVEKAGIPVAALVSTEDLWRLDRLDRERAESFRILDEMGAAFVGVSEEEIERETAKALAEVRADMRAEQARAVESA